MRDAIGGAVTMVIITVFIALVSGYLAFNVNYTKAFRMKNKIVSLYDDYNGDCEGGDGTLCAKKIREYAKNIGYDPRLNCPSGYTSKLGLYCSKKINVENSEGGYKDYHDRFYYKIITNVNINIPIINYFLGINWFDVKGDTKTYINRD